MASVFGWASLTVRVRIAGTSGAILTQRVLPPAPLGSREGPEKGGTALVSVAVGVARDVILDPMPGVPGGHLGLVPGLARGALVVVVPVAAKLGLDVVPCAVAVLGLRLPAIAVGRLIVLVAAAGGRVRTVAVVVAPVGVLVRGIDPLGDAVAHQAAGDGADRRSNQRPDRTADRRADRRARGRARRHADAAADRMDLVVTVIGGGDVVLLHGSSSPIFLVHGCLLSKVSCYRKLRRMPKVDCMVGANPGPASGVLASAPHCGERISLYVGILEH